MKGHCFARACAAGTVLLLSTAWTGATLAQICTANISATPQTCPPPPAHPGKRHLRRDRYGVPHITAGMLDALSGTLEGGRPLVSVTVGAFAPESEVADILRETEQAVEGISIGSYPFFKEGRVGSNFVIRSEDSDKAKAVAEELAGKLAEVGYDTIAGGI